jgi:hypothetical protein
MLTENKKHGQLVVGKDREENRTYPSVEPSVAVRQSNAGGHCGVRTVRQPHHRRVTKQLVRVSSP